MSKSSTRAKQRYNDSHYKQMKFWINPELASAFKASCESANVSMASELSQFMRQSIGERTTQGGYAPDLSSTRKRRACVVQIIKLLARVKCNEERYLDNIPESFQSSDAYEVSELRISQLDEIIDSLGSVY